MKAGIDFKAVPGYKRTVGVRYTVAREYNESTELWHEGSVHLYFKGNGWVERVGSVEYKLDNKGRKARLFLYDLRGKMMAQEGRLFNPQEKGKAAIADLSHLIRELTAKHLKPLEQQFEPVDRKRADSN